MKSTQVIPGEYNFACAFFNGDPPPWLTRVPANVNVLIAGYDPLAELDLTTQLREGHPVEISGARAAALNGVGICIIARREWIEVQIWSDDAIPSSVDAEPLLRYVCSQF